MSCPIEVPFIHKDDLARTARQWLSERHPSLAIPVPIEKIIEDAGLDIVPFSDLKRNYTTDGFLSFSMKAIYVDEYHGHQVENRYRFTLAHEVAHLVLHREILDGEGVRIETVADYMAFQSSIGRETFARFEWQANVFAGLLLMPREPLLREVGQVAPKLEPKAQEALPRPAKRFRPGSSRRRCRRNARSQVRGFR